MSCAVEDHVHRAKMTARTTSEIAACAREETEAYMRAELPSESPDRTSNRVNDHDAVDGSRLSTRPPRRRTAHGSGLWDRSYGIASPPERLGQPGRVSGKVSSFPTFVVSNGSV